MMEVVIVSTTRLLVAIRAYVHVCVCVSVGWGIVKGDESQHALAMLAVHRALIAC